MCLYHVVFQQSSKKGFILINDFNKNNWILLYICSNIFGHICVLLYCWTLYVMTYWTIREIAAFKLLICDAMLSVLPDDNVLTVAWLASKSNWQLLFDAFLTTECIHSSNKTSWTCWASAEDNYIILQCFNVQTHVKYKE